MTALEEKMALAPDYLPPCPNCSMRSMPARAPSFRRARNSDGIMLDHCCELSNTRLIAPCPDMPVSGLITPEVRSEVMGKQLAARAVLANWWKMQRLTGKPEMLALFRERGLTPAMEATR